jgi:hypothetical protein
MAPIPARNCSTAIKSTAKVESVLICGDRALVDSAGQPIQRGPDRSAQDAAGLRLGQRGEISWAAVPAADSGGGDGGDGRR